MSIRLNKLLARRGLGARRKCDALIQSGVVRVNGAVEREPGTMVEPERDRIEVRGRPLPGATATRYYMLHKPVGVISTLHDPEGRRTIRELLPPGPRLFPVGRLDADTSGLLVLTSDGELAHRLMHPRYGVTKSYRVRVAEPPSPDQLRRLAGGVEFEPGVVSAPARAWIVDSSPGRAMLTLVIHEGRYRQVRRMCEAVGLTVLGLHRSAYGPLRLGELMRGMSRELSEAEVAGLRAASARPARRGAAPGRYFGVPGRGAGSAGGAERSRARARAERPVARPDAREERRVRGAARRERPAGARRERPAGMRPERPAGARRTRPDSRAERPRRGAARLERPAGMRGTRPEVRARSSRPFDTRRAKPGRPTDFRRGASDRPGSARRGTFDRPGSTRGRAPDRPGTARRGVARRPGDTRRGPPSVSGKMIRRVSGRARLSGDMARGPGRDGAKFRSRRPARGPDRRRGR